MIRRSLVALILQGFTVALCLTLLSASASIIAATPVDPTNKADGLAVHGYDPVAYFTTGKATPGVAAYAYQWNGATYRFATAENYERFKANPEQYVPQYGGYCAYAMSLNQTADIDPDRWAIVDGKLYLNNNLIAHGLWSVKKQKHIADADRNWALYPKKMDKVQQAESLSK